jgi:PAS domain S-box-containing protein
VTEVAPTARDADDPPDRDLTEQLHMALEASGLGTWRWDIATGSVEWDARLEALYGFAPGTFPGTFDAYQERIHPEDRRQMLATVDAATKDRRPYRVEHRVVWPDGTIRWIQGSGRVTIGPAGEVTGAIGCSLDVTDLMEARLELAAAADAERAHRRRLEFLNRINEALAAAQTRQDVMTDVTRAAVPHLGDWCLIYVLPDPASTVPEVVMAHADPDAEDVARELAGALEWDADAVVGMPVVMRTGRPEFHPDVTDELVDRLDLTPERREIVRRLAWKSVMSVPLTKRGRVIGGLQFVLTDAERRYSEDDLTLAEAVAGRVASALENRRLTDQQHLIASTLQASLLPDRLPDIPNLAVAVRYWASGEGTEVGGDFYDLFAIDDGTWAAVIGDICGTGPLAASLTSLARNTIRLCGWRGDDAVTTLNWLNRAMLEARPGWFLTGAYVTLHPRETGVDLEVTVAGHPLPVIVAVDGTARLAGEPGTLLGAFEDIALRPTAEHLAPGDTLVLYTDGVGDVAPPHGLDEHEVTGLLVDAASGSGPVPPEAIADRIDDRLAAVLPMDDRTDDVALLILQVPPVD